MTSHNRRQLNLQQSPTCEKQEDDPNPSGEARSS